MLCDYKNCHVCEMSERVKEDGLPAVSHLDHALNLFEPKPVLQAVTIQTRRGDQQGVQSSVLLIP